MMYVTLYLVAAIVSFIIFRKVTENVLGDQPLPTLIQLAFYVLVWPILFPLLLRLVLHLRKQIVQNKLAEIFKIGDK